ncbi:MAG TPA: hypothetical protein VGR02_10420 [Thermoanaerobaculia bacterium]|nr:hypothetical protein [Thermoanaerobaculia bacterium]
MKRTLAGFLVLVAIMFPLAAAEVCRFRALGAENPFQRWLASQEVTCVPAGTPVEFPPGLWNVFARGEGVISSSPLLVDGAAPEFSPPTLGPGATVIALLPAGLTGVLYAPRRGSAFPVDAARVTVPADEPLWLFVLDAKPAPVAVISVAPLAPGTERQVDARSGGPAAVVGWLQVPEADRTAISKASGLTSPAVHAGSRDADLLPSPSLLHGAFFRIRDVGPGNAELRLEGRGWVPDRRVVKVEPGVTVAAAPLLVRAAGTLVVHWNADQDLPELDRSIGACEESNDPPQLLITIAKCAAPRRGAGFDPADCSTIREEKVRELFGSLSFDSVVPGLYRAEMRFGKLPPASATANVAALRVGDLRVFATYFTIYGSVTRGGEPLGEKVQIKFPGGIGFAPAETEEYHAVFLPPPMESEAQITVAACDGSPRAVVITDQPMRPRARFDIDIPANELTVHVNDTFTREPLPGAVVKLESVTGLRAPRVVFSTKGAADEEGNAVWTGLPVRETHLTVTHAGYEKRTVEPFSMERRGKQSVDVQLLPLRGTHGKIVSDHPFDSAVAAWFSPSGSETERADISADGTFVYTNWHTPEETMAVVSASHPLWVLHSPATERRGSINLRFPSAPAVAFDVWLAAAVLPSATRHIGVVIGGLRVPQPVLAQHQTLHRDPPLLHAAGPQHFRDLLATGPIEVLYGPTPEEVASRARSMDFFALPQFADAPRQRLVPGTSDVVFAVRPGGRILP